MCKTHEKDVPAIRCRPVPSAAGNRMGLSLVSTGQSTGSPPVRTSAAGGSSPASSPGCTATAGSLGWHNHRPGSQHDRSRPTRVGPSGRPPTGPGAGRGAVPSAWRTGTRNPDGPRGVVGGLDRRGCRLRQEMDAPLADQTPGGPQAPGIQGIPSDHRPADARPATTRCGPAARTRRGPATRTGIGSFATWCGCGSCTGPGDGR